MMLKLQNKFSWSNKLVKQLRLKSAKLVKNFIDKRFGKIFLLEQMCFDKATNTAILPSGEARLQWMVGALMNQAIHYLDLLQWFGGEIIEIKSFNKTLFRNIEAEDTSVNSLAFSNGALGSCNVTMLTYPNNLETSITI